MRKLGLSDSFVRLWEFYLCYCEGGFMERALGDVHMLLAKPDCRTRADHRLRAPDFSDSSAGAGGKKRGFCRLGLRVSYP